VSVTIEPIWSSSEHAWVIQQFAVAPSGRRYYSNELIGGSSKCLPPRDLIEDFCQRGRARLAEIMAEGEGRVND
jgi:hypothetical protein